MHFIYNKESQNVLESVGMGGGKMIRFYYNRSSSSCKKAENWFEKYGIKIKKRIEQLSRADLVHALSLSDEGFKDILKNPSISAGNLKKDIFSMSFDEGVDYILTHTEVVKIPLILSSNKMVLGYNSESIRVFVTRIRL